MTTMKAVRLFEFGGPDKLVYGDYALPEFGAGDVLVKVHATSVSRWDLKYRTGEVHEFYGKATGHHGGIQGRRAFPMPMQLGRDAAGEVAAVGAAVRGLASAIASLGWRIRTIRNRTLLSAGLAICRPESTCLGTQYSVVTRNSLRAPRPIGSSFPRMSPSIRPRPQCGPAPPLIIL
jgi:NADPH:quinone reductase-like Zn-dependent oxidoreductase